MNAEEAKRRHLTNLRNEKLEFGITSFFNLSEFELHRGEKNIYDLMFIFCDQHLNLITVLSG